MSIVLHLFLELFRCENLKFLLFNYNFSGKELHACCRRCLQACCNRPTCNSRTAGTYNTLSSDSFMFLDGFQFNLSFYVFFSIEIIITPNVVKNIGKSNKFTLMFIVKLVTGECACLYRRYGCQTFRYC